MFPLNLTILHRAASMMISSISMPLTAVLPQFKDFGMKAAKVGNCFLTSGDTSGISKHFFNSESSLKNDFCFCSSHVSKESGVNEEIVGSCFLALSGISTALNVDHFIVCEGGLISFGVAFVS